MRHYIWICAVAMVAAGQAWAQVATVAPGAPVATPGWIELDAAGPRLGRADIAIAREVAGYAIEKLSERTGVGFDAIANYRQADSTATIFLYQPIHDSAELHWSAVERAMLDRINAPPGWPVERGTIPASAGGVAYALISSGSGSQVMTDLAALGRTNAGWIIKLRISASVDGATALERARAMLAAVALPAGQALAPPAAAPLPPCAARAVAGEPRVMPASDTAEKRLADAMIAVMPLIAVGAPLATAPVERCALGGGQMGPSRYELYRTKATDGTPSYVAALGDAGVTVSLDRVASGAEGDDWWLTLDLTHERVVVQRWRGPVDDADFARAVGSIEALLAQPYVTRVGRN